MAKRTHIIPVDDLREHLESLDCWCHPGFNYHHHVVHNAKDCREVQERRNIPTGKMWRLADEEFLPPETGMDIRTHLIPVGDTREHSATLDCWCHPLLEGDHTVNHNAKDCREVLERRNIPTGKTWRMIDETYDPTASPSSTRPQ